MPQAWTCVQKRKFGLIVKYSNVVQLANALACVLKEQASELGANGKAFVMTNYSWNVIGKEIENTYRKVIE